MNHRPFQKYISPTSQRKCTSACPSHWAVPVLLLVAACLLSTARTPGAGYVRRRPGANSKQAASELAANRREREPHAMATSYTDHWDVPAPKKPPCRVPCRTLHRALHSAFAVAPHSRTAPGCTADCAHCRLPVPQLHLPDGNFWMSEEAGNRQDARRNPAACLQLEARSDCPCFPCEIARRHWQTPKWGWVLRSTRLLRGSC